MSFCIRISADHDGRRIDKVIRAVYPNVPLSALMRALRKGEVILDSKRARAPNVRVAGGQELCVPWDMEEEALIAPEITEEPGKISKLTEISYIYKDDAVCIVNKPADLLVQPDAKGGDSVITRVWATFGRGFQGFSPAAVHRLDRNTTGVLVVAMSGGALRELELLFKERLIRKTYLAIVVGNAPASGDIQAPLRKDEENNFVAVDPKGKPSHTRYEKISGGNEYSVVSVELLTGRTHQARVHLAHIGIPILGDQKYGDVTANKEWRKLGVERPLLHSHKIIFPEKISDKLLSAVAGKCFTATPPDDMQKFLS
ncbi:MAG: RluA family pseudouridine synthase [Synergistaceae bacterium]|nr:RluA family pseudouridine synthase [Synergistaceae bacterium]